VPLAPVPTRADLLRARLAVTRAALLEVLASSEGEAVQQLVDELLETHDATELARAAVALAHRAQAPADEADIPEVSTRPVRPVRDDAPRAATSRGPSSSTTRTGGYQKGERVERKSARPGWAKLYVGAGRAASVRPQDLVGASAGESHLTGKQIGDIEITERFSLVEVPEADIDAVIKALRSSVIKGRKVPVRRDRDA
jgi:ATP-dependent RNA helicase DeaD